MRDWPVVVTNRCAEACAEEFGLAHPDSAREWLYKVINQRGKVTNELPPPVAKVRSKSGYFMLANDVVVLPLMASSDGTARWIATDCKVFPSYRRRYGTARQVDPFRLTGADLVRHVHFTRRAVAEFQQHCGGDPDPEIARDELHELLSRDCRAVPEPPAWAGTPKADFYLVSADEYVLPASRQGSGRFAFDALSCRHRASPLFALRGAELTRRCRFDAATLAIDPERWDAFVAAATASGHLSWHRPRWARPHPAARFWVVATASLAAPVAWQPCNDRRPLLILDIKQRSSLLDRLIRPRGHRPQPRHRAPQSVSTRSPTEP